MQTIWQYWEGPMPQHIELCLRSVSDRCIDSKTHVALVTPETVPDVIPPGTLNENYKKLSQPAHRCDCIRAALLAVHGGFYFDADTIGIKPPPEIDPSIEVAFCTWTKKPVRALNGYIYCSPGSRFAKAWLDAINARLASGSKISWTEFGEKIVTPLALQAYELYIGVQLPRDTFLPIDVDQSPDLLFSLRNPKDFITEESVCFGLNWSWMRHHRPSETERDIDFIEKSPLLYHQLLKGVVDG